MIKNNLWDNIGRPKTALAPMVDNCDLPFRLLCRKYNTQLTYTQMYHSVLFNTQDSYRELSLKEINRNLDNPCFVQLCGHDPEMLLKCAKILQDKTPCIDLNLGCPQGIAKRGHYGSFLLDHPDEVYKIVGYLCNNNLSCGVSCKIRVFPDLNKTYELARKLEDLGISVLAVHGRTKEQNQDRVGMCNWEAIKNVKSLLKIPVIANGGIGEYEDIEKCFEVTKCDCVMSGEKLLENPTFFSGKVYDIDEVSLEYLNYWRQNRSDANDNLSIIRGHIFKLLYQACKVYPEFNQKIGTTKTLEELISVAEEVKEKRKDTPKEEKFGWYMRYRNKVKEEKKKVEEKMVENSLDSFF